MLTIGFDTKFYTLWGVSQETIPQQSLFVKSNN